MTQVDAGDFLVFKAYFYTYGFKKEIRERFSTILNEFELDLFKNLANEIDLRTEGTDEDL